MAADLKQKPAEASQSKNYKGFVAGVFSGVAKLSGKQICFFSILGSLYHGY
jgi:hypothetical protein